MIKRASFDETSKKYLKKCETSKTTPHNSPETVVGTSQIKNFLSGFDFTNVQSPFAAIEDQFFSQDSNIVKKCILDPNPVNNLDISSQSQISAPQLSQLTSSILFLCPDKVYLPIDKKIIEQTPRLVADLAYGKQIIQEKMLRNSGWPLIMIFW